MKRNKPKYKQILNAAVEVIAENGYHAAQISKIADKANVADGTIYLYFKNKEDILISVFKEKMGEFIKQIEQSIKEKPNVNQKLLTLIEMHFGQLENNKYLAVVTQLELRQSKVALRLEINHILKPYLVIIDTIVAAGIKEGIFRESLNQLLVRQMVFGTLDEVVTSWVMKEQKYSLIEQAADVHDFIINGLSIE